MADDTKLRRLGRLYFGEEADKMSAFQLARRLNQRLGGGVFGDFTESIGVADDIPTSFTDVIGEAALLGWGDNLLARDEADLRRMRENIEATSELNPISTVVAQGLSAIPATAALGFAALGAGTGLGLGALGTTMLGGAVEGAISLPGFADEGAGVDDALLGAALGAGVPLLYPLARGAVRGISRGGQRVAGAVRNRFGSGDPTTVGPPPPGPPPPGPPPPGPPPPRPPAPGSHGVPRMPGTQVPPGPPVGTLGRDTLVDPSISEDSLLRDFLDDMEPTPTRPEGIPAGIPDTVPGTEIPPGLFQDTVPDALALPARGGGPVPPMRVMGEETQGLFNRGQVEAPPQPPMFDPSIPAAQGRQALGTLEPVGGLRGPRKGLYGEVFAMERPGTDQLTQVRVPYGEETLAMVRARDFFRNHKIGRPAGAAPGTPRQWVTREGNRPAARVPESVQPNRPIAVLPSGQQMTAKQLRSFEPDMLPRAQAEAAKKLPKYTQRFAQAYQNQLRGYDRRLTRWENRLSNVKQQVARDERLRKAASFYGSVLERRQGAARQFAFLRGDKPLPDRVARADAMNLLAEPGIRDSLKPAMVQRIRDLYEADAVQLAKKEHDDIVRALRAARDKEVQAIDARIQALRAANAGDRAIQDQEVYRKSALDSFAALIEKMDDAMKGIPLFFVGRAPNLFKAGVRGGNIGLKWLLQRAPQGADDAAQQAVAQANARVARGIEALEAVRAQMANATIAAPRPVQSIGAQDLGSVIGRYIANPTSGKQAAAEAFIDDLIPEANIRQLLEADFNALAPALPGSSLTALDADALLTIRRNALTRLGNANTPDQVHDVVRRMLADMSDLPSRQALDAASNRVSGLLDQAFDATLDPQSDIGWQALKDQVLDAIANMDPVLQDKFDADAILGFLDEVRKVRNQL